MKKVKMYVNMHSFLGKGMVGSSIGFGEVIVLQLGGEGEQDLVGEYERWKPRILQVWHIA